MTHIAFADRAGAIRFGRRWRAWANCQSAGMASSPPCMTLLSALARLAHDNETWLVPGVSEAKADDAALAAVVAIVEAVETLLKERVMTPPGLTRRLAARKLVAARLATDPVVDCERAASGRNGKRADSVRWMETDWRHNLCAAARLPATSRLAPLYLAIGDIEAALCAG